MAIVPLFVCLALAISGLVYHFVKRELVKGLREEATAAATAIAAFTAQVIDDGVIDGKGEAFAETAIRRALGYGTLLRVMILRESSEGNTMVLDLGDRMVNPPSGLVAGAAVDPFRTDTGKTAIAACMPVRSPANGKQAGEVVVCVDAGCLPKGLAGIRRICAIGSLLTIAAGAAVAMFVSRNLSAEITLLHRALAGVGNGNASGFRAEGRGAAKGIREIVDLRNTVATMASVLQWTLHKNRLLAERKRDHPREVILNAWLRCPPQYQHASSNGAALHVMPATQQCAPGVFLDAWRTADGELRGFFGRVHEQEDAVSERVMAASVTLYLRQRLCHGGCIEASVVHRAIALFELADVCVLRCAADASNLDVVRLDAGGFREETRCLGAGGMHVFHNGSVRCDRVVEGLARSLPPMRPETLACRAASLIAGKEPAQGLIVAAIASPASPASKASSASGFPHQCSLPAHLSHA